MNANRRELSKSKLFTTQARSRYFRLHYSVSSSEISLLFSVALVAGAANAIAGGGSFLTFPSLLFTGMPPVNANATNTVAVWPGILVSTSAYRKALSRTLLKSVMPLLVVTLAGSFAGALLLLRTPQMTFMKMVPWLLLAGTILFAFGGKISGWANRRHADRGPSPAMIAAVSAAQFMVGIYIGYYGAGVGFIILPLLSLMGIENIHAMNGLRTLLVTCGNAVAVVLFIIARAVVWPQALLMMGGAILGGYAGAHFAQKLKQKTMRTIVIVIGAGMTTYFFWKTSS